MLAMVAAALALAACAPDSWRRSPSFNDFLWQISRECHPRSIGRMQISNLTSDPFFVNQTSRLYHKVISAQEYATQVNAFFPGHNAAALDCIVERLPQ
jgi:hypothetical protein